MLTHNPRALALSAHLLYETGSCCRPSQPDAQPLIKRLEPILATKGNNDIGIKLLNFGSKQLNGARKLHSKEWAGWIPAPPGSNLEEIAPSDVTLPFIRGETYDPGRT